MKKLIVKSLVLGMTIASLSLGFVFAGNGNDGCFIGLDGHHKSNEHKVTGMTKTEWENYLASIGMIGEQKSNNEGSNGWITYHIMKDGEQVEVVHIKFKDEEPTNPIDDDNEVDPGQQQNDDGEGNKDDEPVIPPEVDPIDPVDPPEVDPVDPIVDPDVPETGDIGILPYVATSVVAMGGLFMINKKKK